MSKSITALRQPRAPETHSIVPRRDTAAKEQPETILSERPSHVQTQYGGNDNPGVLQVFPPAWLPYLQLVRLWPPAALLLIFFPHGFGILHAAIRTQASLGDVVRASIVIFGGCFFCSNAAHTWNDLVDARLDAQVERTRRRPIPRGAITPTAALLFGATQVLGAVLLLTCLPFGLWVNGLYATPNIISTSYYPFAKRHTHLPQLVLGFCLAWGVVMGEVAMGVQPLSYSPQTGEVSLDPSVFCLVTGTAVWALIYDTIYAHQDLQADLRVGIKSLAVLLQERSKIVLWLALALMTGLLVQAGRLSGLGIPYYFLAVGGGSASLGLMIWRVNLRDSQNCWWWFSNGFWWTGGAIGMGLLAEYC
ncbi:4-hydroxybenzoate octaprenyltransferase [Aspergillus saccharolyticus JOP 1030-1]|uniref:Prenyltransferase n=1 Tax=Aspergillus saccharolyticus JOP 1030-1 TaxID=1450539 RepID=A0A318ZH58_9EURO|nr:prenyltransferase [Aspergillus saccharolyticus JOP 1030-1]PYH43913.1 prenyltransferase [Aspergillus saccharolyticus JOP 1030-1]